MMNVKASILEIAPDVYISPTARISARELYIESGAWLGDAVDIQAGVVRIGQRSRILGNCSVRFTESFQLGPLATIDVNCRFRGRRFSTGAHFYSGENVTIGGGGAMGPNAVFSADIGVSIFSESYVNLAEPVTIGSGTALSSRVTLLTHGCWQPILDGYPSSFAPIRLGRDVVVYFGSTILPGCDVGDGSLVAANSLVNATIPAHALAGGNPARVLRQPYPRVLSDSERHQRVCEILKMYAAGLAYKGFQSVQQSSDLAEVGFAFRGQAYRVLLDRSIVGSVDEQHPIQLLSAASGVSGLSLVPSTTYFDLSERRIFGPRNAVVEDLRDFLRRTGIRILDDEPFQPLPPAET